MLNDIQIQILNGLLLGDGMLYLHKNGKNPYLYVKRSIIDLKYLEYHASLFKDILTNSGIQYGKTYNKKTKKTYEYCFFRTKCLPVLIPFYNQWYQNKKKIVPFDLELSPIVIGTWFADDGSIIIGKKKGYKDHPETLTCKFATDGFSKLDVDLLASKLEIMYGFNFKIYPHATNQYTIHRTKSYNTKKLLINIDPYFPIGMDRKSQVWRSLGEKLFECPKIIKTGAICKWCKCSHTRQKSKYKINGIIRGLIFRCLQCKKTFPVLNNT